MIFWPAIKIMFHWCKLRLYLQKINGFLGWYLQQNAVGLLEKSGCFRYFFPVLHIQLNLENFMQSVRYFQIKLCLIVNFYLWIKSKSIFHEDIFNDLIKCWIIRCKKIPPTCDFKWKYFLIRFKDQLTFFLYNAFPKKTFQL